MPSEDWFCGELRKMSQVVGISKYLEGVAKSQFCGLTYNDVVICVNLRKPAM